MGLMLPLVAFLPSELEYIAPAFVPEISSAYHTQIEYISALTLTDTEAARSEISTWSWSTFFLSFYFLGLVIMLSRSIRSGMKLIAMIRNGKAIKHEGYTEIIFDSDQLPFSFFRYVCLGQLNVEKHLKENILSHELHHIKSLHSIDILAIEIMKIIFWWNPIIYMFKKAIEENHEFSADAKVLENSPRKEYCHLLMKTTFPGVNLQLSNPFFQTFIKKRIDMMYQKDSKKYHLLKYGFSIIACIFLLVLFAGPIDGQKLKWSKISGVINTGEGIKSEEMTLSIDDKVLTEGDDFIVDEEAGKLIFINNDIVEKQRPLKVEFNKKDNTEQQKPLELEFNNDDIIEKKGPLKLEFDKEIEPKSIPENNNERGNDCKQGKNGVYYIAEFGPTIAGCENASGDTDPFSCGMTKLGEYVNSIKKYPAEALKEGFQGGIYYKLIIDENGEMIQSEQLMQKDKYGYGIYEEGQRILDEIYKNIKFIPATCDGERVKSQMHLHYRYKIGDSEMPFVDIKDSKTVNKVIQSVTINNINQKGHISFEFRSNLNVPSEVTITGPQGEDVFQESYPYMYKSLRDYTILDNPKNGNYTIEVIQDGIATASTININIFK